MGVACAARVFAQVKLRLGVLAPTIIWTLLQSTILWCGRRGCSTFLPPEEELHLLNPGWASVMSYAHYYKLAFRHTPGYDMRGTAYLVPFRHHP